ncbi:uncharacterized protein LOC133178927 [Saccostrea echinata]|uniref:uncharacterized protein LOC133178927 n=1 Tax=Saccostrea echinata TaxID=191078 RepID=UPI002A81D5B5|nr:uncharacterized protein LOC133178927 [Saccostrea echinata]
MHSDHCLSHHLHIGSFREKENFVMHQRLHQSPAQHTLLSTSSSKRLLIGPELYLKENHVAAKVWRKYSLPKAVNTKSCYDKKKLEEKFQMSMMRFCSFCGIQSSDLQKCSRCKVELYCSRVCQRNHWKKGHKMECKEVSVELSECSFCGVRSPDLMRCSRCKGEFYCSRECQRNHWKAGHKRKCKEVSIDESSSPTLICTSCKKSSEQLKRCTGCLQVSYCSKECQLQDWTQKHKDECVKIQVRVEEEDCLQEVEKDDQKDVVFNKKKSIEEEENDHKSLNVCTVCGEKRLLKVCQRCKVQKYCSAECQKADWKKHKSNCTKKEKPTQRSERGADDSLPICANCKSQSAAFRCTGCRVVYYCSEDCQKSDSKKHKTSCKAYRFQTRVRETLTVAECSIMGLVTPEEHGGRNRNDLKNDTDKENFLAFFSCRRCKSAAGNCKVTCAECKSVMYCSKLCMDLDKSEHRKMCVPLCYQISGISVSSCRGFEDSAGPSPFKHTTFSSPSHAKLPFPINPIFVDDDADLKWIVERNVQSQYKAIEKTNRKFPYHTLITRLREIPIEGRSMFTSNISTLPYVFLACIRRFHNYRGRHNVYLQDSERREIYVSFYLPNDNPTPYFQWSDIVPGKFVAILFPCIHFFGDGTVGLRVDKAKNVYCFDVKD